jgi:hypothetical protein
LVKVILFFKNKLFFCFCCIRPSGPYGGAGHPPAANNGGYGGGAQSYQAQPSIFGVQPTVIVPSHFEGLLERIRRASFVAQKLQEIVLACSGGAVFMCEHAFTLLQEIRGDREQQEGALALYPRVLDPWNFGKCLQAFVFKQSREVVIRSILAGGVPLQSHAMLAGGAMDVS